ncbi:hypothetical protein Bbelb_093600 [Branchiostoma belcheri]|nr:hypothetical protein Bbelb_093600 [Branchiostoma belcheri]
MAAASLPLEEFDEKFLTCAVCEEIYTDPRVLPCLHTFCTNCLEKWRKGECQVTCPTCRNQVRLHGTGISSLPQYFFMNSLLDFRALHKSEEAHTKCQMCKSEATVDGRCADCGLMLCKNCITVHSNIPALKDHYIITMDDLKNPSSRPKYPRAPYCPQHTDQRMTFYCQPCAKLVCRDCTINEHRPGPKHDPQEVSKVAPNYKAELQKLLEKTKHTDDALKKTKETIGQELKSIKTNCQTVRKDIEEHFAAMRAKLDKEEKKAKETLDKMEKDQKEPLVKEEKELEEKIESTEEGLKFSTDILARDVNSNDPVLRFGQKGSKQEQFDTPIDLAVREDKLYVADPCNQRVQVFDLAGNFCYSFSTTAMPWSLAVQADGTIAVISRLEVMKFSSSGELLHKFSLSEHCTDPYGLAVQRDGRVVVTDTDKHSIFLFEADGTLVKQVGGQSEGQFDEPCFVCVDKEDNIIVSDKVNSRIQVFDKNLNFQHKFGQLGRQPQGMFGPMGVSADSRGNIVLANIGGKTDGVGHSQKLQVFRPDGTWVSTISSDGDKLKRPHGVAVTEDGHVFVADTGDHCIRKYRYIGATSCLPVRNFQLRRSNLPPQSTGTPWDRDPVDILSSVYLRSVPLVPRPTAWRASIPNRAKKILERKVLHNNDMAAASLPLEEFDEKFLTCAVCEEIYTDPRVLPCLHTFCANCLEKWRKRKRKVTCPTCREQVRLKGTAISSLPQYFFMKSLLDFRALHNSEDAHTKCQMCKSDNRVEGLCTDCHLLLCKNCMTAHGNIPALKDHYIITLDDLKNPSSTPKYTWAPAPYCPLHTDQRMTFYCQPCAKLVCRDCTINEHDCRAQLWSRKHDPQEVSKVAQKYKAGLETLVAETKDTADVLQKTKDTVGKELTSITENCQTVRTKIEKHFADMRAKLDKEEKKAKEKLDKMEKDQKEPLVKEEKELGEKIKSTEEGLEFCTDVLARGNDVEIVTLRQQLDDRLNVLSSTEIQHRALKNKISFQSDALYSDLAHCYLFLSKETLFITEAPVESLPTTVIFRPQAGQVCKTNPEVTATSPGGQSVKVDTTRAGGTFKAVWRPQTSGKHVVSVTGGGGGGWGELLSLWSRCSPLTVDVSSNDPVLRFGRKGSQQGQFDTPVDLAVRGDRLYVADTYNARVQAFDLAGNFCDSFSTGANPVSIAVQTDGTIVVKCGEEVKRFTPSGELLHKFPLSKHCTKPYGLAVQRNGRVVVADYGKHSIFLFEADGTLVFDKNMNFQHKHGQKGRQPQDMWGPMGVSTDSRGEIVLVNIGGTTDGIGHSQKLQVFRPDGTWVSTISSDGDKLNEPHGVAVTEDGHVFVADPEDHCIKKYKYIGLRAAYQSETPSSGGQIYRRSPPEHPGTETPRTFCRLFVYVEDVSAPGYSGSYLAGARSESVTAKTSGRLSYLPYC